MEDFQQDERLRYRNLGIEFDCTFYKYDSDRSNLGIVEINLETIRHRIPREWNQNIFVTHKKYLLPCHLRFLSRPGPNDGLDNWI